MTAKEIQDDANKYLAECCACGFVPVEETLDLYKKRIEAAIKERKS